MIGGRCMASEPGWSLYPHFADSKSSLPGSNQLSMLGRFILGNQLSTFDSFFMRDRYGALAAQSIDG
jgi:hypothetical protein